MSELLVALLKSKSDFAILRDEGWYRIPVEHKPRRWPPKWLAFYQPGAFLEDAFRIRYFGRVSNIEIVKRHELFPNEFESARSDNQYYRIQIDRLQEREKIIPSRFPRRVVFISTTWDKFNCAEQINDLFDESPLEDELWRSLQTAQILAERQWEVVLKESIYQLDFAIFCQEGQIDVEADGDTYHAQLKRIPLDNARNNALTSSGWSVLRFNGRQIHENKTKYCLGRIEKTINKYGGLTSDGLVPRKFFPEGDGVQQLTLFE